MISDRVRVGKVDAVRTLIGRLVSQAIANAVVAMSIVTVAFALTGRWPPPELLAGASIGGALSPVAWRTYRAFRPHCGVSPDARGLASAPGDEPAAATDGGT
jgi:hypothetical protein